MLLSPRFGRGPGSGTCVLFRNAGPGCKSFFHVLLLIMPGDPFAVL